MDALDIISWAAYSVYIVLWYAGKALVMLKPLAEPIADMFEHAGAVINPAVTYLSSLAIPLDASWINFLLWLLSDHMVPSPLARLHTKGKQAPLRHSQSNSTRARTGKLWCWISRLGDCITPE